MNLHAHFESHSTDCDGAYSRDWVVTMNESELAGLNDDNWFGDIAFHDRIVAEVVTSYSLHAAGRLDIRREDDETLTLDWSEATEEGGRSVTARTCNDEDCDVFARHQRDHAAEAAGY